MICGCNIFQPKPLKGYFFAKYIGKGYFGTVSRHFHLKTLSMRAIKQTPTAKVRDCIENEIDILRSLEHPNVVKYFEVVKTPEYTYVVMEYLGKRSLYEMIKSGKVLLERNVRDIVTQIASGLAYLHSQGVAHLDLKPNNVMMTVAGQCKIIDFGCSKRYPMSTTVGSFFWDTMADVWCFGALLLFIVLPKVPSHLDCIMPDLEKVAEALKGKSKELLDLVHRMFELCRDKRITSAEVLKHRWLLGPKERMK